MLNTNIQADGLRSNQLTKLKQAMFTDTQYTVCVTWCATGSLNARREQSKQIEIRMKINQALFFFHADNIGKLYKGIYPLCLYKLQAVRTVSVTMSIGFRVSNDFEIFT